MASTSDTPREAPTWTLPSTQLITIEYPGYIHASVESLDRALTTLAPMSGPMAGTETASNALAHLAALLERGARIVECRLLPWHGADGTDVYRHPLLGDVVPSHDLVVRVHKKMWRRAQDNAVRKQYTLELVGACAHTVRFRRMADFGYKPDPAAEPTMSLHRALMTLDVDAMRSYKFAPETEEYEVTDRASDGTERVRSTLAMIPPPVFSRQELPFPYAFRQNPTSSLQTVSHASTSKRSRRTARKGEAQLDGGDAHAVTRYINRARWRNLAPIAIKFSDNGPVPSQPDASLAAMPLSSKQKAQLAQLKEQCAKRPVWSRLALLNQFSEHDARALIQSKELFALVAYTFADGPWRDTLVRFGYDPRADSQSRFYQRIHMRGKAPQRPTTRGLFKAEYGAAIPSRVRTEASPALRPPTHIFDGKATSIHTCTFQLCDITALSIVPLIHVDGTGNLLPSPDVRLHHSHRSRQDGTRRQHGTLFARPFQPASMHF